MPDVRGYSKDAASNLLKGLGISAIFEGEGKVTDQNVPSGELINKGTSVKLTLNSDYKD